jgi:integrase
MNNLSHRIIKRRFWIMINREELFAQMLYIGRFRIAELLILVGADILQNGKIAIPAVKSRRGEKRTVLALTEQLSKKLKVYIRENYLRSTDRLFPYTETEAHNIATEFSIKYGFESYQQYRISTLKKLMPPNEEIIRNN